MKFPVFDLHCDTALALLGENMRGYGSLRSNQHHIDLERAAQFPGYAQCFACFTTTEKSGGLSPVECFERELSTILREVEKNSDKIRIAYTGEDIRRNISGGLMSAILTIEGPAGFGFDPQLLEDLYQVGFRITTLGWNEKNPLTGSHVTGGGLTQLGKEYVKKAQQLGMIIDVSHISDEGFYDIMDITTGPVIASHSNSRSVWEHSRNITDDMFLRICQTGGTVGINQYAAFVGEAPTADTLCDHILHFLSLDPTGKHISLGGDFDGCETLCQGVTGIESYPSLAQQLMDRGVEEGTVHDIFWNNAIGVMDKCCI